MTETDLHQLDGGILILAIWLSCSIMAYAALIPTKPPTTKRRVLENIVMTVVMTVAGPLTVACWFGRVFYIWAASKIKWWNALPDQEESTGQ